MIEIQYGERKTKVKCEKAVIKRGFINLHNESNEIYSAIQMGSNDFIEITECNATLEQDKDLLESLFERDLKIAELNGIISTQSELINKLLKQVGASCEK